MRRDGGKLITDGYGQTMQGKVQPDTRNPVLVSALEVMDITENRYSGIPTIRMEMEKYNLAQPEFLDERGSFIVKLYKQVMKHV